MFILKKIIRLLCVYMYVHVYFIRLIGINKFSWILIKILRSKGEGIMIEGEREIRIHRIIKITFEIKKAKKN